MWCGGMWCHAMPCHAMPCYSMPCRALRSHVIPGHALHEKGLQRQTGVGPLVSSQEQRALLVSVISRLSTNCQPVVNCSLCSFIGLHRISLVRACGETFRRRVFDALGGTRDACLLGKLFCRRPILPGPAPPSLCARRLDPPWYVRVLDSTGVTSCRIMSWHHMLPHVMSCHIMSCSVLSCHGIWSPDLPCMKMACRVNQPSAHWSATRNEERPLSRALNVGTIPISVYVGIRVVVLTESQDGVLRSPFG